MQRALGRSGGLLRSAQRARAVVRRDLNAGERQIGDYPNLKWESAQTRDPFKFWDKQDRRNYAQPLHEQDEVLSVWVYDFDNYVTKWQALGMLTGVAAGLAAVGMAAKAWYSPARNPAGPREFPFNDIEASRGGYALPMRPDIGAAAAAADE